MRHYLPLLTQ